MVRVIVVGGGAAGMMAAISAADSGADVVLIEKNEKLGKKIYITGKGRCNITNESDVEDLLKNVRSNPKFLYSAFYTFDSYRMMDFLESEGLKIKTERGNRVFPESDKSSDVIRTLKKALEKRGVKILLNTKVNNIEIENGVCRGVVTQSGNRSDRYAADKVIVATGGCSYQSTGSTGDGYRFAKEADIKVTKCYPSLVPFNIDSDIPKRLQGLSLRNVKMTLTDKGKVIYEELGEMLFTHFGVSGPLVLSASTLVAGKDMSDVRISIDLKPALSNEQLDERILRDFSENKNSYFKNSLSRLLPSKMIPVIVEMSGIDEQKQVNNITKEERHELVGLLKGLTFKIDSLRGFNEAIITKGGVSVKEINPGTMESKKVKGLFFAGEVLDLDAVTGGYNLQIAWSTGYLAGM
ncbi:NAD(P)/FAD-dependent oxidoreductase [Eubacterium sp. MSJ-13]|uniref:NAD(P)/FAD-dependent oxidoreductase n=1 Tax=Eubacterium sp. MSJ-13 TaxID=2841513 RepID=UPI001C12270A|nr:NAD(P)/FAD-dependent oxidoreductase [Eubacterium sp. MSJ-13]MBU5478931.1 NAD(P)/FAD-dependent oxidoreductase [Eubacterium sp. MSJ-13]